MMNPLILLALCALFVLSEAIRLEALAQTLGGQQDGKIISDTEDSYSFNVKLAVGLDIAKFTDRADASKWHVHGVWEPDTSVADDATTIDELCHKTPGLQYTPEWSAAVLKYNTDAAPEHKVTNGQVTRIGEDCFPVPNKRHIPTKLIKKMGADLVIHEYTSHGYYLPIPIAGFYGILLSESMDLLKNACAEVASGISTKRGATKLGTSNGIDVELKVGPRFLDCVAKARVIIKKLSDRGVSRSKKSIKHRYKKQSRIKEPSKLAFLEIKGVNKDRARKNDQKKLKGKTAARKNDLNGGRKRKVDSSKNSQKKLKGTANSRKKGQNVLKRIANLRRRKPAVRRKFALPQRTFSLQVLPWGADRIVIKFI